MLAKAMRHSESAYTVAIRQIRPEENAPALGDGVKAVGERVWAQSRIIDWCRRDRPVATSPAEHLNSASISVICRRMIATERARSRGRSGSHALAFQRRLEMSGRRKKRGKDNDVGRG